MEMTGMFVTRKFAVIYPYLGSLHNSELYTFFLVFVWGILQKSHPVTQRFQHHNRGHYSGSGPWWVPVCVEFMGFMRLRANACVGCGARTA